MYLANDVVSYLMNSDGKGIASPYLMIDSANVDVENNEITVTKYFDVNECMYEVSNEKETFPQMLLIEIAAQGAFLLNEYIAHQNNNLNSDRDYFLAVINQVDFYGDTYQGQNIETKVKELRAISPYLKVSFECKVGVSKIAEGIITLMKAPSIRKVIQEGMR